ncbi:MAG: mannose-6-phosphate isomerase, class I [Flavisolibacter sp.]|nr:mannose-6-phosphate isomerase, class I [Flavisolibacter sp.]
MSENEQGIFLLKGNIQRYNWGGYDFIPRLLGIPNEAAQPCAEYWLGAHPNFPAMVINGEKAIPLNTFIESNKKLLGSYVADRFHQLPFLLKVLDVRQMLSIQVHPSKEAAKKAFEEENKKGISRTAPHRNYKDDNHKPELMVALSDFWLLHGFKPAEALHEALSATPELSFLTQHFNGDYRRVYHFVMTLPQAKADQLLAPLAKRVLPLYEKGQLEKHQPDFWAARAIKTFCNNHYDRGLFSIYLFNLLHLKKGEGIYQPAGMPHAYLEGQNVEIMANSDNVLRAGLTDKHIDVNELLKHVQFSPTIPHVLHASDTEISFYPAPAAEFQLYQYHLHRGAVQELKTDSAEIWLLLNGEIMLNGQRLARGQSAFIPAGTLVSLTTDSDAVVFRAGTPVPKNE